MLHMISGTRPKLERLQKQADRIMETIIKEHIKDTAITKSDEAEVEEDLVDVLLKFHDHGGGLEFSLTTDNIKAVLLVSIDPHTRTHFLLRYHALLSPISPFFFIC